MERSGKESMSIASKPFGAGGGSKPHAPLRNPYANVGPALHPPDIGGRSGANLVPISFPRYTGAAVASAPAAPSDDPRKRFAAPAVAPRSATGGERSVGAHSAVVAASAGRHEGAIAGAVTSTELHRGDVVSPTGGVSRQATDKAGKTVPPRKNSPAAVPRAPRYRPFLPMFDVTQPLRTWAEVSAAFPRMHMPDDFVCGDANWVHTVPRPRRALSRILAALAYVGSRLNPSLDASPSEHAGAHVPNLASWVVADVAGNSSVDAPVLIALGPTDCGGDDSAGGVVAPTYLLPASAVPIGALALNVALPEAAAPFHLDNDRSTLRAPERDRVADHSLDASSVGSRWVAPSALSGRLGDLPLLPALRLGRSVPLRTGSGGAAAAVAAVRVRHNVRVVMLAPLPRQQPLRTPPTSSATSAPAGGSSSSGGSGGEASQLQPLRYSVKFLVTSSKEGNGLQLLGGAWNAAIDGGGDPGMSDGPLVACGVRHVAAQTGIDLRGCRAWVKFAQLRYHRGCCSPGGRRRGGGSASAVVVGGGDSEEDDDAALEEVTTVLWCLDPWEAARTYALAPDGVGWVAAPASSSSSASALSSALSDSHCGSVALAVPASAAGAVARAALASSGIPSTRRAGGGGGAIEAAAAAVAGLSYDELRAELARRGDSAGSGRKQHTKPVLAARLAALLAAATVSDTSTAAASSSSNSRSSGAGAAAFPQGQPMCGVGTVSVSAADASEDMQIDPVDAPPASASALTPATGQQQHQSAQCTVPVPPAGPCVLAVAPPSSAASATPAGGLKHRLLSLDGLLDYEKKDVRERTFEVSLFAEMFRELVARDMAGVLAASLLAADAAAPPQQQQHGDAAAAAVVAVGDKRSRAVAAAAAAAFAASSASAAGSGALPAEPPKRARWDTAASGGGGSASLAPVVAAPPPPPPPPPAAADSTSAAAASAAAAIDPCQVTGTWPWAVESAWQWFDTACAGYLEAGDLQALLARAGLGLSRRAVRALVRKAAVPPPQSQLPSGPPVAATGAAVGAPTAAPAHHANVGAGDFGPAWRVWYGVIVRQARRASDWLEAGGREGAAGAEAAGPTV